jgi:hypothetical protein
VRLVKIEEIQQVAGAGEGVGLHVDLHAEVDELGEQLHIRDLGELVGTARTPSQNIQGSLATQDSLTRAKWWQSNPKGLRFD